MMMCLSIIILVSYCLFLTKGKIAFIDYYIISKLQINIKMKLISLNLFTNVLFIVTSSVRHFLWALFKMHVKQLSIQQLLTKFVYIYSYDYIKYKNLFLFKRRPVLVYIHHDISLFSNIFCKTIFCTTITVDYLLENYIVWPWDITQESNRNT
jgi:hypothetical protein